MERKLTGISRFTRRPRRCSPATAVVAGCGGGGTKSDSAGQGTTGTTRQAVSGKAADYSLAKSHMRVLTTLKRTRLCRALSTAEAVGILHARTAPPVFASHPGVAITRQWTRRGQGRQMASARALARAATPHIIALG